MFIEVSTVNGQGKFSIRTDSIIRFRPSFGTSEPVNCTIIDCADQRFESSDDSLEVVDKIGDALRLARLTTPVGEAVFINADKATSVRDSTGNDPQNAKAVVRVAQHNQAVMESRAEAAQILANS